MSIRKQIDLKHHAELVYEWPGEKTATLAMELENLLRDGSARIEIVKTTNGQAVPGEEPMILFRGRDYLVTERGNTRLAADRLEPLLMHYRRLCIADGCNDFQLGQITELIERFQGFARDFPERMKQPGVTRGA